METLFTRLEEASHAGDVNLLKELLKIDKLLLEKVTGRTSGIDNPLHIAALLGHADFIREVISHKPELARELNEQGFSPLHLAAAEGHITVVKELLKAGLDLCLLSEKQDGLLPLHIAVKKRRTLIVKELVDACQEAVHGLTNNGDTILHFAVKYNSFDTVEFLIDRVHNLNAKDDRGNTILHHAVASKQLSVIKYLLSRSAIDVNTMNLKCSTPLDVLLESRQQNGDLIIGEIIRAAGGKTAAEVFSQSEPVFRDSVSSDITNPIPTPRTSIGQPCCLRTRNNIKETNLMMKKESKHDPQILLLVATLVATVTFQAALNPPGGYKSDTFNDGIRRGRPLLSRELNYFIPLDMFALFLSVSVMMLFLCVVPRKTKIVMKLLVLLIWGATFSMGLAFTYGIFVLYVSPYDDIIYSDNVNWVILLVIGWYIVLRLGISWVLVRFLIFLLNKSGLSEPAQRCFASLKRGCFLKWQQFCSTSKINGPNCWELFRKVLCIVLIIGVVAGITAVWVSYMYRPVLYL